MRTYEGPGDNHPDLPHTPTSPGRPMTPTTAAHTTLHEHMAEGRPGGNEQLVTGQLSPGGKTYSTSQIIPVEGDTHSVDREGFMKDMDTHASHSHPIERGDLYAPSVDDAYTARVGAKEDPPIKEMIKVTPHDSNASEKTNQKENGFWLAQRGELNDAGQPRFHKEHNPYNMDVDRIKRTPDGWSIPIPTDADLKTPPSPR
jgi:hypothetical protein